MQEVLRMENRKPVSNAFSICSILQKPSPPTTESMPILKEVAASPVDKARATLNFSAAFVPCASLPPAPPVSLLTSPQMQLVSPPNLGTLWPTRMNYLAATSQLVQLRRHLYENKNTTSYVGVSQANDPTWGASSTNYPSSNIGLAKNKHLGEISGPATNYNGSSCSSSENESESPTLSGRIDSEDNQASPSSSPASEGNKSERSNFKKARTSFTNAQIKKLELKFNQQKYLARRDRTSLARALGLTEKHVKTWYQNRRTKWKKECSDEHWSKEKEMAAAIMYMQHIQKKNN